MSNIEEDGDQSNDGQGDVYEDSNEPQAKRFRGDFENINDYNDEQQTDASQQQNSPWDNPPPNFNNGNGAQNNNSNNQKTRGRRQGSRWSTRR